ncbi:hypothetical protein DBZ36_00735 [Alginatibacterium sediminis]|uniref:Uncharacterized protein n=1 Tax=Alginatibacterium sediminis TaxID=2164068 RepID=A0A420ENN0_9ALTE|nr:hypothetical protein [Alginatibacterium sediminis]RKF22204.1 hypothetical protein DBZ36_00735 [Alginatibacterium sediminis]
MASQGSGGNVIAALCNVFIPGLGQLIQGRLLAAIVFFVLIGVCYWSWVLVVPAIIGACLHLWCIIDAARFST